MHNRSVPVSTVLPHLVYADLAEAIDYLSAAFGFTEHYRYGNPNAPQGAQMSLGDASIMLEQARGELPPDTAPRTQYLTIFVTDVEAHYHRAIAAGARIFEELNETVYGERQYGAVDCGGHHWLISEHIRDADPASWGDRRQPAVVILSAIEG